MGLDMYLKASKYVGGYTYMRDGSMATEASRDEARLFDTVLQDLGLDGLATEDSPSFIIELTVLYWRKANAVHAWFVRNVQNGVDDCKSYYVDRDKLIELRDQCSFVLRSVVWGETIHHPAGEYSYQQAYDEKIVEHLHPYELTTQDGFFFGSTDYDQWYVQDIERTFTALTKLLSDPRLENMEFQYQSSW